VNKTPYATPQQVSDFCQRIVAEIAAQPGVTAVSGVDIVPLSGGESVFSFNVQGRPPLPPGQPPVRLTTALPGYFEMMRIPLLRGRTFTDRDNHSTSPVMVVSDAFARRYFRGEDPIGRTLVIQDVGTMQIIGVVGDVKLLELSEDVQPMFYRAALQTDGRVVSFLARGRDPAGTSSAMRAALKRVDPAQPVVRTETVDSLRASTLATRRFALMLLGALAVIALLLAAVGIYSVMSYVVSQSTAEIGVRMALGARAHHVFRLVVGRALRLVAVGAGIGIVAAFVATRSLRSILFDVAPGDPLTFGLITLLIAVVAVIASWVPARRAARVDPVIAIRTP
jgi:putative ABC transport system permease protein